MLNEQDLIAYLENTLSPSDRQRVEAELERDPQLRRELVQQLQMEQALRTALGEATMNDRVKQSVLAVVRGEREEALKQRVLADASPLVRSRRRESAQTSPWAAISQAIGPLLRRPAWAFSLAATCVVMFLGVWFTLRPAPLARGIEMPTEVALGSITATLKPGDIIRAGEASSTTVKFADGTTLHLEPGTEISLVAVDTPARTGGKQLKLLAGSLSADVAKQPPGLPLLIQTPHALVTVVGTEFDLSVATNQTALEVTHGLVKMTGSGETNPVSVAAGEFAVASPSAALRYGRLARNPFLWPFSSASIWNRPLGSGAKFASVPGRPFLADGPLVGAMRPRRPLLGGPRDPLRGIWVGGERVTDARLAAADLPDSGALDNALLFQRARRHALELRQVTVRADGDLAAQSIVRTDLAGPGVSETGSAANAFGLSQFGGLIHAHELQQGIPHALSCRVKRERLGGRKDFQTPSTVWPASGGDAANGELLDIGTLLAIPPDVDIAAKFGTNGPAYELARAMQDYGVYVTGFGDAPFVLLRAAPGMSARDEDALLNQLVPLLRVVANNSPAAPSGGGTPRRASAPELPGEVK